MTALSSNRAQLRAVGGDQATPDTVLADVPVPQRQRQALAAHQAGAADSDRRRRLLTSHARLGADREPLIGVKTAITAPGMPDHPGPQTWSVNGPGTAGATCSCKITAVNERLVASFDVTGSEGVLRHHFSFIGCFSEREAGRHG